MRRRDLVITPDPDSECQDQQWVDRIADRARAQGHSIALAESLTAGRVAALLGAGEKASVWFRGALVAYSEEVKFSLLGVPEGPVVTDGCARQMAVGVRDLLGADVGLGLTGVGGPGPQEQKPAGTVHLAVATADGTVSREVHLQGGPEEVIAAATTLSLRELGDAFTD
jgi:nicotinamide-nucleotide amidase